MNTNNVLNSQGETGRIGWVEYGRGIAIFSVVLWHVVGGVIESGIKVPEGTDYISDAWDIYILRLMPFFFLVSGAFSAYSIQKLAVVDYIKGKLRTILYPYFLWSVITLSLGTIMVNYTNHGVTLADLPNMFYRPIMHYWFLYALFICMMLYAFLTYVRVNAIGFFLIATGLYIFGEVTTIVGHSYILGQICYFMVYFAAGVLIGKHRLTWVNQISTRKLISFVLFSIFASVFVIELNTYYSLTPLSRILSATLITTGTIALSVLLDRFKLFPFIADWGRLSLEIYLVHVLFLSATRIVMLRLSINDWILHTMIGTTIGLYGPILLTTVVRYCKIPFLFSLADFSIRKTPINFVSTSATGIKK